MSLGLKFIQFSLVFVAMTLMLTLWVSVASAMLSSHKKISLLLEESPPSITQTASTK